MISIFLIPRFGMVGAATGFSSVYAVTFFVLYYFTRRTRMFRLEWKSTLKIWASSILMALAVLGVEMHTGSRVDMLPPLYILLGAAIYVILFRLMRAMSPPEDASVLYVQFPKERRCQEDPDAARERLQGPVISFHVLIFLNLYRIPVHAS
ncbi:polysaccharide biosynthesis C-terminal domain-containing protein [Thermogymnomonas acidicola]|uniref:polysaccharide biosynthesis C-terminal domain-containing protein n=1 Tax=Thermogymnomonas acidicola TaxID=399579 RepID=UPI00094638D3|nr:polysaccharide biosynthesis C-terminal domain-containing protein [Thermogymnomonas acidicola]